MAILTNEPRARAQSPEAAQSADRAEEVLRRGNEFAKAGRWPEAAALYREAIALRNAWDIAGNLGIAELEVGRPQESAARLHYALAHMGATAKPEVKELFRRTFERAEAQVGAVTIRSPRAGAKILLDGVEVAIAPLEAPLFLLPGRHRVAVSGPGVNERGETTVDAVAGQKLEIAINTAGEPPPTVLPPPDETVDRQWWPALALGGGAAIGLGVGVGLLVASSGARDDAATLGGSIEEGGGTCNGTETSGECFEAVEKTDTANSLAAGSVVAFTAGGLLVGGLLAYVLWPSDDDQQAGRARRFATPYASPEGAGVILRSSF